MISTKAGRHVFFISTVSILRLVRFDHFAESGEYLNDGCLEKGAEFAESFG